MSRLKPGKGLKSVFLFLVVLLGILPAFRVRAELETTAGYDPLAIDNSLKIEVFDQKINDANRGMNIPVRLFVPFPEVVRPVLIFSHGLGGSCENNAYLGNHWSGRGYVVVFIQHPGSDESVWKGQNPRNIMSSMQQAASGRNLKSRIEDVKVMLDQLFIWNNEEGCPIRGMLDLNRIGFSGHSFGARTAQAIGGQWFPIVGNGWNDDRVKAAVMFSPSAPKRGNANRVFAGVKIPWMLMTGTNDIGKIGGASLEERLNVFPNLPEGAKYELVLYGAEHSAFSERSVPGEADRNPNHRRVILALTTAFWDAWLCGDESAKAWLDGPGPATVLEERDRWQCK